MNKMQEFKIGPKDVTTLRDGVRFHSVLFLKYIATFYILAGMSWLLGMLSRRIYPYNAVEPAPNFFTIFTPTSFVVLGGLAIFIIWMAKRDAFNWFKMSDDEIIFIRKYEGKENLVKNIRYEQIKFLILDKRNFFRPYVPEGCTSLGVRYHAGKTIVGLDTVITLGPKIKEDADLIVKLLRTKCPNIQIISS